MFVIYLLKLANHIFELVGFPPTDLNLPVGMFQILAQFFNFVKYFFPVDVITFILTIVGILAWFRLTIAILKALWSIIPLA